jgi:ubiquinone/menaquinone biosynthesis C-methylase UbiE
MIPGRFNSDAVALKQRIASHDKYGSKDLNAWIFDHLQLQTGLAILDLGCGPGKQSLPLAQLVGRAGHLLSVDISKEAVEELWRTARELELEKRISVLRAGLDELGEHLEEQTLDRVVASFSLYYARYPQRVLQTLYRALKPGGILFFCGPSHENNEELKRFHYSLPRGGPVTATGAAVFMEEIGQRLARDLFGEIELSSFENCLRFNSADALYSYWSSYNLYDPKLDAEFRVAAAKYFETHSLFETRKRVIGVKAVKWTVPSV